MKKVRYATGFFEILAFFLFLIIVVLFAIGYERLSQAEPERDHFIIVFWASAVMYGMLFLLKRFPRIMIYPVSIVSENIEFQALLGRLMLSIFTMAAMAVFLMIMLMLSAASFEFEMPSLIVGIVAAISLMVADMLCWIVIAKVKEKKRRKNLD